MSGQNSAFDYLSRLQDRIDRGENPVQDMMRDLRLASLNGSEETRRRFIDMKPDLTTYYRKMSRAEYNAATTGGTTKYNFKAPFSYTNSTNYRLWVSTSLDKVRIFGNEDATTDTDVIVQFEFSADLTKRFTIKAHQENGVQGTPGVVALHREGFAAILVSGKMVTNLHCDEDVKTVLSQQKAFNLGFTANQQAQLNSLLSSSTLLNG